MQYDSVQTKVPSAQTAGTEQIKTTRTLHAKTKTYSEHAREQRLVRKANAGRGEGEGGERTEEPEGTASTERERGDPPRRRGEGEEKEKAEKSEVQICDFTSYP